MLANDLARRVAGTGRREPRSLEEARGYADELSVVPEARLAVELGATAMHDPTEGGVVGAAWEMAEASGCGFRIQVGSDSRARRRRVPICAALGVDPLRLIASGALLIACPDGAAMVAACAQGGMSAAHIGS